MNYELKNLVTPLCFVPFLETDIGRTYWARNLNVSRAVIRKYMRQKICSYKMDRLRTTGINLFKEKLRKQRIWRENVRKRELDRQLKEYQQNTLQGRFETRFFSDIPQSEVTREKNYLPEGKNILFKIYHQNLDGKYIQLNSRDLPEHLYNRRTVTGRGHAHIQTSRSQNEDIEYVLVRLQFKDLFDEFNDFVWNPLSYKIFCMDPISLAFQTYINILSKKNYLQARIFVNLKTKVTMFYYKTKRNISLEHFTKLWLAFATRSEHHIRVLATFKKCENCEIDSGFDLPNYYVEHLGLVLCYHCWRDSFSCSDCGEFHMTKDCDVRYRDDMEFFEDALGTSQECLQRCGTCLRTVKDCLVGLENDAKEINRLRDLVLEQRGLNYWSWMSINEEDLPIVRSCIEPSHAQYPWDLNADLLTLTHLRQTRSQFMTLENDFNHEFVVAMNQISLAEANQHELRPEGPWQTQHFRQMARDVIQNLQRGAFAPMTSEEDGILDMYLALMRLRGIELPSGVSLTAAVLAFPNESVEIAGNMPELMAWMQENNIAAIMDQFNEQSPDLELQMFDSCKSAWNTLWCAIKAAQQTVRLMKNVQEHKINIKKKFDSNPFGRLLWHITSQPTHLFALIAIITLARKVDSVTSLVAALGLIAERLSMMGIKTWIANEQNNGWKFTEQLTSNIQQTPLQFQASQSCAEMVFQFIAKILFQNLPEKFFDFKVSTEWIKRLHSLVAEETEEIMQFLFDLFVDLLGKIFGKDSRIKTWVEKKTMRTKDKLMEIDSQINSFAASIAKINITTSIPSLSKLEQDVTELDKKMMLLHAELQSKAKMIYGSQIKYLEILRVKLSDAMAKVIESKRFQSQGVAPVVLYMAGAPGVGKSYAVQWMTRSLAKIFQKEEEYISNEKSVVFNTTSATKHFDNYEGQFITVLDDAFQQKSTGESTEGLYFIHMAGGCDWSPPMASVSDKGKQFVSKAVLMTSNKVIPEAADFGISQEAMLRRFGLHVIVVKKENSNYHTNLEHLKFFVSTCKDGANLSWYNGIRDGFLVKKGYPENEKDFREWKHHKQYKEITPTDLVLLWARMIKDQHKLRNTFSAGYRFDPKLQEHEKFELQSGRDNVMIFGNTNRQFTNPSSTRQEIRQVLSQLEFDDFIDEAESQIEGDKYKCLNCGKDHIAPACIKCDCGFAHQPPACVYCQRCQTFQWPDHKEQVRLGFEKCEEKESALQEAHGDVVFEIGKIEDDHEKIMSKEIFKDQLEQRRLHHSKHEPVQKIEDIENHQIPENFDNTQIILHDDAIVIDDIPPTLVEPDGDGFLIVNAANDVHVRAWYHKNQINYLTDMNLTQEVRDFVVLKIATVKDEAACWCVPIVRNFMQCSKCQRDKAVKYCQENLPKKVTFKFEAVEDEMCYLQRLWRFITGWPIMALSFFTAIASMTIGLWTGLVMLLKRGAELQVSAAQYKRMQKPSGVNLNGPSGSRSERRAQQNVYNDDFTQDEADQHKSKGHQAKAERYQQGEDWWSVSSGTLDESEDIKGLPPAQAMDMMRMRRFANAMVLVQYNGTFLRGLVTDIGKILMPSHIIPVEDRKKEEFEIKLSFRNQEKSMSYFADPIEVTVKREQLIFASDVPKDKWRYGNVDLVMLHTQVSLTRNAIPKNIFAQHLTELPFTYTIINPEDEMVCMHHGENSLLKTMQAPENLGVVKVYMHEGKELGVGRCGALLLREEAGGLKVCGMYTMYHRGNGLRTFQPITAGLIRNFNEMSPTFQAGRDHIKKSVGSISYVGDSEYGIKSILNTKLQRSQVQSFGDKPNKAPAKLTFGAIEKAVIKKAVTGGNIDEPILQQCIAELYEEYHSLIGDCKQAKMVDAINGRFDGELDVEIDMTTSAGYPWTEQGKKKKDLFKDSGTFCALCTRRLKDCKCDQGMVGRPVWEPTEELREDVQRVLQQWYKKEFANLVYTESLKDELRPIDKVKKEKTRLFSGASVSHVVADRMIMGQWVHRFKKNRIKLSHAYGISPQTREWSKLAEKHLDFDQHFCVDYEGYDGSIPSSFIKAAYRIIAKHYPKDTQQLIEMSGCETSESKTSLLGHLMVKDRGNPSGCYLTTVVNVVVNDIIMLYVFKKMQKESGSKQDHLRHLRKHSRFTAYGDDYIMSVGKQLEKIMTPQNVAKQVEKLGMKMTVASQKDSNDVQFVDFSKVTFLARSFKPMSEVNQQFMVKAAYTAPLDKDSIENACFYHLKGATKEDDKQTMYNQLMEAVMWGKPYLQELYDKLLKDDYAKNLIIDFPPSFIWKEFWSKF